jgi:hypothetical protein
MFRTSAMEGFRRRKVTPKYCMAVDKVIWNTN